MCTARGRRVTALLNRARRSSGKLIHDHHYNTGTRETGGSDYTGADGKTYNTKNEEQRTVGVGPHRHSPMTKNQLRKEFTEGGLGAHAERPFY